MTRKTSRRWVSPEQIEQIASADPRRSSESIAAEMGLSRWTVRKYRPRMERGSMVLLTEDEFAEIRAMIDGGWNTKQIMRRTGRGQAEVLEARAERSRRNNCARTAAAKLARMAEEGVERPKRDFLAELLRWRKHPLHSLTINERPRDYPGSVIGWAA